MEEEKTLDKVIHRMLALPVALALICAILSSLFHLLMWIWSMRGFGAEDAAEEIRAVLLWFGVSMAMVIYHCVILIMIRINKKRNS